MKQTLENFLGHKPVIMIADDEEDLLLMMQLRLRSEGFDVIISNNAENVFSLLDERTPDLILLDISMNGTDGGTICKELKTNSATQSIPIMMFSANPNISEIAASCGAEGYIPKPFNMDHMRKKIRNIIENSKKFRKR
jgi:DNA-binding response OmpR family regulator